MAGRLAAFLGIFLLLQGLWAGARGSAMERAVIDQATVGSAVVLINWLTPEVGAIASGPRIRAPGGGLNILNGCEGVEVLFLLLAGLSVLGLPARRWLVGVTYACLLVFALNQLRILALFYAYRSDKSLFSLLHGTVAPVVLIALAVAFLAIWTKVGAGKTAPPG